jgi:hypothetical protein
MPLDPFKSRVSKAKIYSTNPRTVANRSCELQKDGFERAMHRDQVAFRVAKSRMLKKLHASKQFKSLSVKEQENAEGEAVEQLEKKYEDRKQLHKLQWIGEPEGEEPVDVRLGAAAPTIPDTQSTHDVNGSSDEEGWSTCSDSKQDREPQENFVGKMVDNFSSLGGEFQATIRKYGEGWSEKIQAWQKRAVETNAMWEDYVAGSLRK